MCIITIVPTAHRRDGPTRPDIKLKLIYFATLNLAAPAGVFTLCIGSVGLGVGVGARARAGSRPGLSITSNTASAMLYSNKLLHYVYSGIAA